MKLFLALSTFPLWAFTPILAQIQPSPPPNTPTPVTPPPVVPPAVVPGGQSPTPGVPSPTTTPATPVPESPTPEVPVVPPQQESPNPNAVVSVLKSRVVRTCYAPNRCTSRLEGTVRNRTGQLVYSVGIQTGSREGGRNMVGNVHYLQTPALPSGTVTNFSVNLPLELSNNAARVIRVFWKDAKGATMIYEPQFVGGSYLCGNTPCNN